MHDNLEILDTVMTTATFTDEQVLFGDIGAVVEIYATPTLAYEVEFVNPDGTTRALLTLQPNQLRLISNQDVLTTRPLLVPV